MLEAREVCEFEVETPSVDMPTKTLRNAPRKASKVCPCPHARNVCTGETCSVCSPTVHSSADGESDVLLAVPCRIVLSSERHARRHTPCDLKRMQFDACVYKHQLHGCFVLHGACMLARRLCGDSAFIVGSWHQSYSLLQALPKPKPAGKPAAPKVFSRCAYFGQQLGAC